MLFNHQVMSNSLWCHGLQHARLPCPSPSPGVCPSSCPLNWWCHPTISFFVALFSFWLQSFPARGSFPVSQLFESGGQSIGASASASFLPKSIQGWFPLRLTDLISLLSRGPSESSPTLQFESINSLALCLFYCLVLTSIHDSWKDHSFDYKDLCQQVMSLLFNMPSRFVMAFFPRGRHRLISCLQSPSSVILEPKKRKSVTAFIFPLTFAMKWWGRILWA